MKKSLLVPAILMVLGLGACASFRPGEGAPGELPPRRVTPSDWVGILPPESTVFASVNVSSFQPLLTSYFPSARSSRLLDRLDRVYAGITLSELKTPEFSLIGVGDFRPGRFRVPLCLNREWRRVGKSHWVQQKGESSLELAVPRRDLMLAANGSLSRLLARYEERPACPLPDEVSVRMADSELLLFFPGLEAAAAGLEALPVKAAFLEVAPAGENYQVSAGFIPAEMTGLGPTAALVRLAAVVWLRRVNRADLAGKLKNLEIRTLDGLIRIEGLLLTRAEIEGILSLWIPLQGDPR
jgi:hypothetical protein